MAQIIYNKHSNKHSNKYSYYKQIEEDSYDETDDEYDETDDEYDGYDYDNDPVPPSESDHKEMMLERFGEPDKKMRDYDVYFVRPTKLADEYSSDNPYNETLNEFHWETISIQFQEGKTIHGCITVAVDEYVIPHTMDGHHRIKGLKDAIEQLKKDGMTWKDINEHIDLIQVNVWRFNNIHDKEAVELYRNLNKSKPNPTNMEANTKCRQIIDLIKHQFPGKLDDNKGSKKWVCKPRVFTDDIVSNVKTRLAETIDLDYILPEIIIEKIVDINNKLASKNYNTLKQIYCTNMTKGQYIKLRDSKCYLSIFRSSDWDNVFEIS